MYKKQDMKADLRNVEQDDRALFSLALVTKGHLSSVFPLGMTVKQEVVLCSVV